MEALREGMRQFGEALAEEQRQQGGAEASSSARLIRTASVIRWGVNPASRLASDQTATCCRAKTSIAGRRTCWMRFVAVRASSCAPKWSATTSAACSTCSDRRGLAQAPFVFHIEGHDVCRIEGDSGSVACVDFRVLTRLDHQLSPDAAVTWMYATPPSASVSSTRWVSPDARLMCCGRRPSVTL